MKGGGKKLSKRMVVLKGTENSTGSKVGVKPSDLFPVFFLLVDIFLICELHGLYLAV